MRPNGVWPAGKAGTFMVELAWRWNDYFFCIVGRNSCFIWTSSSFCFSCTLLAFEAFSISSMQPLRLLGSFRPDFACLSDAFLADFACLLEAFFGASFGSFVRGLSQPSPGYSMLLAPLAFWRTLHQSRFAFLFEDFFVALAFWLTIF